MGRFSKYVAPLVAAVALAMAGAASAFVVSHASSKVVQPQPPPGSCHMRGTSPFNLPDSHCTPGALNGAVSQATIKKTICRSGYSSRIRPSVSVTEPEKLASIGAYGLHGTPRSYEYDHLIPLELGGAANDSRNLWPEPGASPNRKDKEEDYLHARVCEGRMSLGRAQRIIAGNWVSFYDQYLKPKPSAPPAPSPPGHLHCPMRAPCIPAPSARPRARPVTPPPVRTWSASRLRMAVIAGAADRRARRYSPPSSGAWNANIRRASIRA